MVFLWLNHQTQVAHGRPSTDLPVASVLPKVPRTTPTWPCSAASRRHRPPWRCGFRGRKWPDVPGGQTGGVSIGHRPLRRLIDSSYWQWWFFGVSEMFSLTCSYFTQWKWMKLVIFRVGWLCWLTYTLRIHQTRLAGKWTIDQSLISDVPMNT